MTDRPQLPRAIMFDWDSTLVDSWPAIAEANNLARSTFGLETWTVEESRVKSARPLKISYPEWFGDNWEKARDIFYERYYAIHAQRVQPMPGAVELIAWLAQQDIPLMIVSNKKGDLLREEVEALGWAHAFKAVLGSGDAPRDKPNPEIVRMALDKAQVQVEKKTIWFVGDSQPDVDCALLSGMVPVLVFDTGLAAQLGLKWSFLDCVALKSALYNLSNNNNDSTQQPDITGR